MHDGEQELSRLNVDGQDRTGEIGLGLERLCWVTFV
jgi:hypothetical protein